MADLGYSSEYEVYLTDHNGMQVVTNELSLRILQEMRYREVSPTEMAIALNLSKSTIQGNINKLFRMGIVVPETSTDDARSVVYHISAMMLFSNDTTEEWQLYARQASLNRIIANGRCTNREDLSLYCVSLMESGLNIVYGLSNVGAALVRNINDADWWNRILKSANQQFSMSGISMKMSTDNSLTLIFESEEDISDIPMMIVPMIGALRTDFRTIAGYNLSHEIQLSVENNGRFVKIEIHPFQGQDYDAGADSVNPLENFRIPEQFAIYSVNGKAMLFTNSTMVGILDSLFDCGQSLNELELSLNLPKATIYVSLTKLMALGAVKTDDDTNYPKKYVLSAEPLMYTSEPNKECADKCVKIVEKFRNGDLDYYSAVISYALHAIEYMGIHFDKMFMRSGRNTAHTLLDGRSMEAQDFVDLGCTMVSAPDDAEVISYLPIRIRLNRSEDSLWDAWPGDFVIGFVDEGLKMLLNRAYPISVETYYEGQTEPATVQKLGE